jgi:5'-3' exonuclease
MGVPAFFKWLTGKYGRCLVDALEEKQDTLAGSETLDISLPNPVCGCRQRRAAPAALPPCRCASSG